MVDVVATPARAGTSYVEWGAVFAGALAASAISFVLLTAGASVGLSLISPYAGQSYSKTAASLAVFWSVAVPILSFLVGGYIAGRMRSAWEAASSDEVQFRDGMHGMLVWALSIVAGGLLAFLAAGAVANSSAQMAAGAMSNRDAVVAPAIDTLFGVSAAQAAPAAPAAAAPSPTPRTAAREITPERVSAPWCPTPKPAPALPAHWLRRWPPGSSHRRRSARSRRSCRNVRASPRPRQSSASIRPTRMR